MEVHNRLLEVCHLKKIVLLDKDLDGAMAAIIIKQVIDPEFEIRHSRAGSLSTSLQEIQLAYEHESITLWIVDMTPSYEWIRQLHRNRNWDVKIWDHHEVDPSIKQINVPWITIKQKSDDGRSICASDLLVESHKHKIKNTWIEQWLRWVRIYDTWHMEHAEWEQALAMELLLKSMTFDVFVERFSQCIEPDLFDEDIEKWMNQRDHLANLIEQKTKEMTIIHVDGHKVAIVGGVEAPSLLLHELMMIAGTDVSAVYNKRSKTISLRSKRGTSIHVGKWAAQYGGGGHRHAAGMPANQKWVASLYRNVHKKVV